MSAPVIVVPNSEKSIEPILLFDDKSSYSNIGSTDISAIGTSITGAINNVNYKIEHSGVSGYTLITNQFGNQFTNVLDRSIISDYWHLISFSANYTYTGIWYSPRSFTRIYYRDSDYIEIQIADNYVQMKNSADSMISDLVIAHLKRKPID